MAVSDQGGALAAYAAGPEFAFKFRTVYLFESYQFPEVLSLGFDGRDPRYLR